MLKQLLKDKKVWIPIAVGLVLILTVLLIIFVPKGVNKGKQNETPDHTSSDKTENNIGNEDGLEAVEEDEVENEATITPPASWGDNETSTPSASQNNQNDASTENPKQQEETSDKGENVSGEEILNDQTKFGTIF